MSHAHSAIRKERVADILQTRGLVWGLDVRAAHDRRWASRAVRVVRCGGSAPERRGPGLYLLVDADDLVSFSLRDVVRRLKWLRPRAMRLRISESASRRYAEHVIRDDDGAFEGIRRDYSASKANTGKVALTTDPVVAQVWRDSLTARDAWRAIRHKFGRDTLAVDVVDGRVDSAASPDQAQRAASTMLQEWHAVAGSLDGVYEYAPGVWVHETSRIGDGVQMVGPLWIGAGVRITDRVSVVGPGVLPDAPNANVALAAVDWVEVARSPARLHAGWRGRRRNRRVTKRLFDILFSAAVLVATAPLYPLIMLAIFIEDGRPFFFAHTRQSVRGREFPCYKFRTMCRDAEKLKKELARANQADGPQFFIEKDPRLLKVGRILRKFQLDEFPQFWNVLLGHMSVVGPRPSPDKENQYCPAWREARLSVRPGVTGLWQVRRTRAPETDFQEWIRYDLEYVQRQSWRLDIWIILQTMRQVLGG